MEEDEEIRLGTNPAEPSMLGAITFNGSTFRLRDVAGSYDPRTGGGIGPAQFIIETSGALVYAGDGELVLTV